MCKPRPRKHMAVQNTVPIVTKKEESHRRKKMSMAVDDNTISKIKVKNDPYVHGDRLKPVQKHYGAYSHKHLRES